MQSHAENAPVPVLPSTTTTVADRSKSFMCAPACCCAALTDDAELENVADVGTADAAVVDIEDNVNGDDESDDILNTRRIIKHTTRRKQTDNSKK